MRWNLAGIVSIATVSALSVAMAQPSEQQAKPASTIPLESVVVTTTRPSQDAINDYIDTRTARTYFLGRMARWTHPVCPLTVGLGDTYAKYVSQRIRDIGAAVGAPVGSDPECRTNIEIVFTTAPQGLLDNVRKKQPLFLGYHNTSAQADALAKVTHSIQSWYTTETIDDRGTRVVDNGRPGENTVTVDLPAVTNGDLQVSGGRTELSLPSARFVRASGWRTRDGLSSGLFNILVVAEPAKLYEHEVGSLADYIAMLVLSQPASLDRCQDLLSISNLLAPGCASAATRITDGDLAYLRALYKAPSGYGLTTQVNMMRSEMTKTLVTGKTEQAR